MNLQDLAKKFVPQRFKKLGRQTVTPSVNDFHPDAIMPQPPHTITNDGEVIAKTDGVSRHCLRCNGTNVIPVKMPGFTMYECLDRRCGHIWRDSYDKPGQDLRLQEWKQLRKRGLGRIQGRIIA